VAKEKRMVKGERADPTSPLHGGLLTSTIPLPGANKSLSQSDNTELQDNTHDSLALFEEITGLYTPSCIFMCDLMLMNWAVES